MLKAYAGNGGASTGARVTQIQGRYAGASNRPVAGTTRAALF